MAFCIMCARLSWPDRWWTLAKTFGRSFSTLIFTDTIFKDTSELFDGILRSIELVLKDTYLCRSYQMIVGMCNDRHFSV